MSYRDFYPPGAADDPNAPYNQPEPVEDTDEFQDKKEEMTDERVERAEGYLPESFAEVDSDFWIGLSVLFLMSRNDETDRLIGAYIRRMFVAYCTPTDSEVIEELEAEYDI